MRPLKHRIQQSLNELATSPQVMKQIPEFMHAAIAKAKENIDSIHERWTNNKRSDVLDKDDDIETAMSYSEVIEDFDNMVQIAMRRMQS